MRIARLDLTSPPSLLATLAHTINIAFIQGDAYFKLPSKRSRLDSERKLVEMMQNEDVFFYGEREEVVVGCIRVDLRLGSFGMVSVPERFGRKGVGKELVGRAEQELRGRGWARVEITVVNVRTGVIDFYERLGYEKTGRQGEFEGCGGG